MIDFWQGCLPERQVMQYMKSELACCLQAVMEDALQNAARAMQHELCFDV